INKKRLAIGVGVAILAGFAYYTYSWAAERKEQNASEELLKAQLKSDPAEGAASTGPSSGAYLKVATDFSGTQAGGRAELLAAEAYFNEKNFAAAQEQFAKFRNNHPDSPLAASAAFGVAASLDSQGKLAEAIAGYQEVATRYASSSVVTQAKLAMARAQEAASKPDLALKIYDELASPNNYSAFTTEANELRDQLLNKHPDLKAASTLVKPVSVTTNAAGQRITLTPVATTNSTGKGGTNKPSPQIKLTPATTPSGATAPAAPVKK
ncbi:MAG TPA: tetratricopeptide repeat protein, partial [Verrucomicrobiae bacterium]|nr:tetratricopeptide repeat protein [Verrucomicrobiae bacterium]